MTVATDGDTTQKFQIGVDTEQVDVPGHGGKSRKEAVFNWMVRTKNLWMLTSAYADRTEAVVGVSLLFKISNLKIRWQSSHAPEHPALIPPTTESAKNQAFKEFERFFKTLPMPRRQTLRAK